MAERTTAGRAPSDSGAVGNGATVGTDRSAVAVVVEVVLVGDGAAEVVRDGARGLEVSGPAEAAGREADAGLTLSGEAHAVQATDSATTPPRAAAPTRLPVRSWGRIRRQ